MPRSRRRQRPRVREFDAAAPQLKDRRVPLRFPFTGKGDGAAECRLAAFELPGEAAEDQPLVLQLRSPDIAAQILDVNTVFGEQGVVRELVGGVGKQLVDRFLAAELL